MTAVTDIALELASDIAAKYADESDAGIRRWACGQIMGAWRLAMRLDYDAAESALDAFKSIEGRLEKPTPEPGDTP